MYKKLFVSGLGVLLLCLVLGLTGVGRTAHAADIPVHDPNETAEDDIASGTWGSCKWRITSDGVLTIGAGLGEDITSQKGSPWYNNRSKIKKVRAEQGVSLPSNSSYLFYYCSSITEMDLLEFDTTNVTSMSYMFYDCYCLTSLDLSGFNTLKVTDMSYMFDGCSGLTSLDLSTFNTTNVTDMSYMFGCRDLTSLNLSNFDTQNVTSMKGMFWDCSGLTSLNLANFNTAKVTNMSFVFQACSRLTFLDLSTFDTTNVTDMRNMFSQCSGLTSLNLDNFNTAKVENMSYMFEGCSGLETLDLSNFTTQKVDFMDYMFSGCINLKSLDLSNFDTINIRWHDPVISDSGEDDGDEGYLGTMDSMFSNCPNLTRINIGPDYFNADVDYSEDLYLPGSSTRTWVSDDGLYGPYTPTELQSAWKETDENGIHAGLAMAGWYEVYAPSYTLVFNANDGSGQMVNQKIKIRTEDTTDPIETINPNTFYKFNYTFVDWNTEADGTGKQYDPEYPMINEAEEGETITLYAQWSKNETKFNVEDGEFEITVPANARAIIKGISGGATYQIVEDSKGGWVLTDSANTDGAVQANDSVTATFDNQYQEKSLTFTPSATKLLDGTIPSDNLLTFDLYNKEGNIVQTVTNVGSSVSFQPVTVTMDTDADGNAYYDGDVVEHEYRIVERTGDNPIYDYDDNTFTVSFKTTLEDGKIRMYDYEESGSSTFMNSTLPGSLSITKNTNLLIGDNFTFTIDFSNADGTMIKDGEYDLNITGNTEN